jgi:integrase
MDPRTTLSVDAEPAERALKGGKLARKKHFQHGSLFKRGKKNKVWVARFREPIIGPDGESTDVRRSEILGTIADLPTKRDAEIVLARRLQRLNSANYNPRSCCRFRDFVEEWKTQTLPALKYATQKHYEYVIDVHLLPAFGDVQLRFISRESIQALVARELQQGLGWRTVKHVRTTLGTILGTAEVWGYIDDNPVRKTRLPRRGPRPEKPMPSPEQLRLLLEKLPEPSNSLAWLLVLTGLRIGELLALRWQDVDLAGGVLRVRRTLYEGHFDEPKTKSSMRVVPLGPQGREIFSRIESKSLADPQALVFQTQHGTPLCRRNLSHRQLQPGCRELKIEGFSWHSLRHANATLLDAVGTPIGTTQALLGHSSSEITRSVYVHALPAGAREAVEKVEALLIGPKRTQIEEIPETGSSLIQ